MHAAKFFFKHKSIALARCSVFMQPAHVGPMRGCGWIFGPLPLLTGIESAYCCAFEDWSVRHWSLKGGFSMERPWRERLSVLEISTMRWNFEDDAIRYRDHGYRAIGVWRAKLSDFGESKGQQLLEELGMSVSSLHWAGGFTGFDGRSHAESLYDALDAVHVASELQADCLVILAGARAGHTRSHVRRLLVSALKEVAQAASVLGVQLALEPMHSGCAQDFSFLTSIPETLDILTEIDQSNLGIVFDCYHMAQDARVFDWLPAITPHIRLVQCGDSKAIPCGLQNRCLLGHGRVPIAPIIQSLESNGYRGYYEVELIGEDVEDYDYDELLESSHQTLLRLTC